MTTKEKHFHYPNDDLIISHHQHLTLLRIIKERQTIFTEWFIYLSTSPLHHHQPAFLFAIRAFYEALNINTVEWI